MAKTSGHLKIESFQRVDVSAMTVSNNIDSELMSVSISMFWGSKNLNMTKQNMPRIVFSSKLVKLLTIFSLQIPECLNEDKGPRL